MGEEAQHAMPDTAPLKFSVRRYQSSHGSVTVGVKVSGLEIAPLDVESLYTEAADSRTATTGRCVLHEDCRGHLLRSPAGGVLLPSWMLSEDPELADQRTRATLDYVSARTSAGEYSRAVRSTLMGKRGLARFQTLGARPLASVRGVAVCNWNLKPREVALPRLWARLMKVATRARDELELSPTFTYRECRDGDMAVLIRCPVITHESTQPVAVRLWDEVCIGVNPEMCKPLNLDFDGDEVHVYVVSSVESAEELARDCILHPLDGLSGPSLSRALERDGGDPPGDAQGGDSGRHTAPDLMARTTRTLHQVCTSPGVGALAGLARCREAGNEACGAISAWSYARASGAFFAASSEATMQMTRSHLTVSMGYTFGRQLKAVASTMVQEGGIPVPSWAVESMYDVGCTVSEARRDEPYYGLPCVRICSRLGGVMAQAYLDMAKRTVVAVDDALLMGLVSSSTTACHIVDGPGGLDVVAGPLPTAPGVDVIASTHPGALRSLVAAGLGAQASVMLVYLLCRRLGIPVRPHEASSMASMILYAVRCTGSCAMTSVTPTRFLSRTRCDWLTASLVESIDVMDSVDLASRKPQEQHSSPWCTSPYVAMVLGNVSKLAGLSLSAVPRGRLGADPERGH